MDNTQKEALPAPDQPVPHAPGHVIAPTQTQGGLTASPTPVVGDFSNAKPAEPQPSNEPPTPIVSTQPPTPPGGTIVGGSDPINTQQNPKQPRKKRLNKYIITALILMVIVGAGLSLYFGYFMNPSVIWSNSLSNTNKGYDSLVSYINTQSKVKYQGLTTSGSISVKENGTTYSGSFSEQNDSKNSQATLKLSLGPANLEFQELSITQPGATSPDVYLNISGFKGLGVGSLLGSSGSQLDSLDGQWISIDHTIIAQIQKSITSASTGKMQFTQQDLATTAQDIGSVNKQYVFTTNEKYAVTTVVKKYGFVELDGRKTYHYKVGFVKANVESYITALRNSIQNSPFGQWLSKSEGLTVNDLMNYSQLEASAGKITSSDTMDVWTDVSHRVIYKVRISDSANSSTNYVDIGLNYKQSNQYPFFLDYFSGSGSKQTVASLIVTLNTLNHSINESFMLSDGGSVVAINGQTQPTNNTLKLSAPANAISLQDALNRLGLSSYYNLVLQGLSSVGTSNSTSGSSSLGSLFLHV